MTDPGNLINHDDWNSWLLCLRWRSLETRWQLSVLHRVHLTIWICLRCPAFTQGPADLQPKSFRIIRRVNNPVRRDR